MVTVTIDEYDMLALGAAESRSGGFVQAKPRVQTAARLVESPLRRDSFELQAGVEYDISFRRVPNLTATESVVAPTADSISLAELIGVHVDRPLPDSAPRPRRWRYLSEEI